MNDRLTLIDSLRGVAALWVMLFHFYFAVKGDASQAFPEPFHSFLAVGDQGVFIFFVLSGFVISLAIRQEKLSPGYIGRFFLRRSIRLDIPYWIAILMTGLSVAVLVRLGVSSIQSPTPAEYSINMLYLDNLLNVESIVSVGWTLQYEIQFYLFYILWIYVSLKLAGERYYSVLMVITFGLSLLYWFPWFPFHVKGLFLDYWFYFLLGVFTEWTLRERLPQWALGAIVAAAAIHYVFFRELSTLVALATTGLLFAAGKLNSFNTWLNYRWLLFLGTISYSLYLIHPFLGNRILRFLAARMSASPGMQAVMMIAVALFTIAFVFVFFKVIEAPAHRLSKKVKMK